MLAHHHVMKTRDNMSAVIEGLQRRHGLLAAYLEASDKIDWRALHKRLVIAETPKPVNVEAHQVSAAPQLPEGARPPRQAAETAKAALKMGRHRTVCWVVVSAATHTRPPWASRLTCNS